MKKQLYSKPIMYMETFVANTSVAYCTNIYDTESWNPQTVNCVISSSDNIFGTTNCANLDGYTVVDAGTLTYVEGEGYFFIWSNTTSGGGNRPDDGGRHALSGQDGLKTILAAAGIDTSTWMNYHAGPVTVTHTTVEKQNWSL